MLGNELWCSEDYAASHWPKCAGCSQAINPDGEPMTTRNDKRYSLLCLLPHHHHHFASPRPLHTHAITLNAPRCRYHNRCCLCEVCGNTVGDQGFLIIGDKLTCRTCVTQSAGTLRPHPHFVPLISFNLLSSLGPPAPSVISYETPAMDSMEMYQQMMAQSGYMNPYMMGMGGMGMGMGMGMAAGQGQDQAPMQMQPLTPEMMLQYQQLYLQQQQQLQQGGMPPGMY